MAGQTLAPLTRPVIRIKNIMRNFLKLAYPTSKGYKLRLKFFFPTGYHRKRSKYWPGLD